MNSFINWQKFGACEHFINAFSNFYLGENPEQPSPSALSPQFSLSLFLSLLPRPLSWTFSMTPSSSSSPLTFNCLLFQLLLWFCCAGRIDCRKVASDNAPSTCSSPCLPPALPLRTLQGLARFCALCAWHLKVISFTFIRVQHRLCKMHFNLFNWIQFVTNCQRVLSGGAACAPEPDLMWLQRGFIKALNGRLTI